MSAVGRTPGDVQFTGGNWGFSTPERYHEYTGGFRYE